LDLSSSLVVGGAATYAGGTTSSTGTGSGRGGAGRGADPRGAASSSARGDAPSARADDRSRRAALAGGSSWQCPFPTEALVDEATVLLRVQVDASGAVAGVSVLREPGDGFGREAARCARSKSWSPALDRDGRPVAAAADVNVRFQR
jgi:protein TonB